jgi:hypothetical protein
MNWSRLAEDNWTSARVKQWTVAAIISIRLKSGVCGIGDDTMTKLRGAWQMYQFIRQYRPAQARQLRKAYGYSRFYDLYKEWSRYEFDADTCIEHLTSDLSNAAMVMQIVDTCDPREEWERNAAAVYKRVFKLAAVNYGAPEWFCNWARDTKDIFERNGIK